MIDEFWLTTAPIRIILFQVCHYETINLLQFMSYWLLYSYIKDIACLFVNLEHTYT